jgi:thiamine-phosphate pyrophosphorylase
MDHGLDLRRRRLRDARLYLVCDRRGADLLDAVLAAGVDVVQLRDKHAADEEIVAAATAFRRSCDRAEALFVLNDRPDLVAATGADGVHLGQDDLAVPRAREIVGAEAIIGLSTHSADQVGRARGVDYVAVGPVHATPTKPGRPAVGLDLVRHAARHARVPVFAIGGIDAANVAGVLDAGARRIAVVRAIAEAGDPPAAARALRAALDAVEEATVGTP